MEIKEERPHQVSALTAIAKSVRGIINLPTGTGKTLIQSRAIIAEIKCNPGVGVYVINSPRILLSNQILEEVRADLMMHNIDAQYLVVHSGHGDYDAEVKLQRDSGLPFRETANTTSRTVVQEKFAVSCSEKVPLIISSTYNSFGRVVASEIPLRTIHNDEAHYLVREQFEWISAHQETRAFFYTATMKVSASEVGIGMNNTDRFGGIISQALPVEMVNAGEITRPRIHLVDMQDQPEGDEGDALAIIESFNEHRTMLKTGAKLLIVAKGQEHLNRLVASDSFKLLMSTMPTLKVFDITSDYGSRVNGVKVKRQEFFKQLKGLTDNDNALILHVDILAEGIDVPGITGIMVFDSLSKSKFLQTLGRATRLHPHDRKRLYAKELTANDLKWFVKPYSYIVIPVYGSFGEDLKEELREMIVELRGYGFNPSEDIVTKMARGKKVPAPIDPVNSVNTRARDFFDFVTTVYHEVEEEEAADLLAAARATIVTLDDAAAVLFG